jgi:hypothetical protein
MLSPRRQRIILVAGILFFIIAKACFILSQTAAMGMPRLGDDAFTHLWRAQQIEQVGVWNFILGKDVETRAGDDILRLCRADADPTPETGARCARVADNTAVPDVKPAASLLLHGIVQLGLPLKWSYAVFELLIACAIAGGFTFFLARLYGPGAAGIALVLLSFLNLLPPQGLHQFVASTLAIGLSLGLWGMVIRSDSVRRYVVAGIGFAILSRVHPVALVYAGGLPLLAAYAFRAKLTLKATALIVLVALAAAGIFLALSDTIRHIIGTALSADLLNVLAENVQALPNRLTAFAARNWGIVLAGVASLALWRRISDGWTAAVALALALLMAASLFYRMEFFIFNIPLDLFARIFVGFSVFACGFIAAALVRLVHQSKPWVSPAAAVGIVAVTLPSLFPWMDSLYGNINGRREVVDELALDRIVAQFDKSTALAFGELDIAPTAAFLAGAAGLGAIPMNGLSQDELRLAAAELHPAAVVVPNFTGLNTLALANSRSLEQRRYGFAASAVDGLAVTLPKDRIGVIHLLVENTGNDAVTIGSVRYIDDRQQEHPAQDVTVAPGSREWIAIEIDPSAHARTIIMKLPASELWINGIAVNESPRSGVNWPWDSGALVQWHMRDTPRENVVGLAFTVPALFRAWKSQSPGDLPLSRVLSDESGLVFIGTDYRGSADSHPGTNPNQNPRPVAP